MTTMPFYSTCRSVHRQRPGHRQRGPEDARACCLCQAPGLLPVHAQDECAEEDPARSARTDEERAALMTERMNAMQDGMAMLYYMSDAGLDDLEGMPAAPAQ
ncbi:MAG: hypothetical protein Q7K57_03910 [Burkholderiaceae bacterium]|nr:hypothetical protein [Burkholderiaceae bacterium]